MKRKAIPTVHNGLFEVHINHIIEIPPGKYHRIEKKSLNSSRLPPPTPKKKKKKKYIYIYIYIYIYKRNKDFVSATGSKQ